MKLSRSLLILGFVWVFIFLLPYSRHQALSDWKQILLGGPPPVPRSAYLNDASSSASVLTSLLESVTAHEQLRRPSIPLVEIGGVKVKAGWKALLELYPNDRRVWLTAVIDIPYSAWYSSLPPTASEREAIDLWRTGNYIALTKRFPNDIALQAAVLISVVSQPYRNETRHPGPLSAVSREWSVSLKDEWSPPNRALWDSYRQRAIAGQKREPNNAFWWWMELYCALKARRDNETWVILKAGSTKTQFDDHSGQTSLWVLEAGQQVFGPLSSGQITQIDNRFTNLSSFRAMCREVMENVIGQSLLGHHKVALEGALNLLKMSRVLRLQSKAYIPAIAAISCESVALLNTAPRVVVNPSQSPTSTPGMLPPPSPYAPPPRLLFGANVSTFESYFTSLSFYARQQGRLDIVRQANREWKELGTWNAKIGSWPSMDTKERLGIYDTTFAIAVFTSNYATVMLRGLVVIVLGGCIFWLAGRFARVRQIVEANHEPKQNSRNYTSFGQVFLSLVVILIPAVVCGVRIVWLTQSLLSSITTYYLGQFALTFNYWDDLPTWGWGFWAATLAWAAAWKAVGQQRLDNGHLPLKSRLIRLLQRPEHGLARLDVAPLMVLCGYMAYWTVLLGGLVCFFYYICLAGPAGALARDLEAPVFYGFCALCVGPCFLLWLGWKQRRLTLVRWSRNVRQLFLTHALVVTVLYGLICFVCWGAAIHTEARARQNFQVGEMSALRKAVGL